MPSATCECVCERDTTLWWKPAGMWVCISDDCVCTCVCVPMLLCLLLGVMKETRVYIFLCVSTLPHPWRAVWGILRRFCSGGRWVLGVFHSDVISPDNGLVKAGILRAPSPFDCVGQLWRNGHYLPVSSSIKKPPCPSYPCVKSSHRGRDMGRSHTGPEKVKATRILVHLQTFTCINDFTLHLNYSFLNKSGWHCLLKSKTVAFHMVSASTAVITALLRHRKTSIFRRTCKKPQMTLF